jgi:lysophospholipase L1-like esterase
MIYFAQAGFSQGKITDRFLNDTISTLPDHFTERVKKFTAEPVVKGRILFLGNSITEMGNWGKLTGDSTVVNRGIGGDVTYSILKRLDDVILRQPSKIFLMIGINDIGKDIPDAVIAENIRTIINRIQGGSPSTVIFLENILPVNPDLHGFPQHYDKNPHVLSTNRMLEQIARDTRVQLIDMHSFFSDRAGKLKKEYTLEGLHINPDGYELWVAFLKKQGYL